MTKFEVLLVVKNAGALIEKLKHHDNINIYLAAGEEAAIDQMNAKNIDIIVYEGSADFSQRNKLKSLKTILRPDAEIIEYDERNLNALPDDLEMAMQKINSKYDGTPRFFEGPEL